VHHRRLRTGCVFLRPAVTASPFPPPPHWAHQLRSVGVTGTNGKTSTTRWVAAALQTLRLGPVARVTTVGSYLDDEQLDCSADYAGFLHTMRRCHERGGRVAALECTSEALALGFAQAWPMHIGVFTNLSQDHLDAHQSVEHYLASKAQLFTHLPAGATAVLNAYDDAAQLLREVLPSGVQVLTYGVASRAREGAANASATAIDLLAHSIHVDVDGTTFGLARHREIALPHQMHLPLAGEIYVENALAALAAAIALGTDPTHAAHAIGQASPPPGRFEIVARSPLLVIDYAHTPDALARTLHTARNLTKGELVVVFGAGGNRDVGRRPLMGSAAAAACRVVLTSDNPRDEDPMQIALAIRAGLPTGHRCDIELDRCVAIRQTVLAAAPDDVVVIAGKGHESAQLARGVAVALSDVQVAKSAHAARRAK
jgi:UDP-N-acetylmuramoyl-L-alanyl-D-glutamate--2,6-diaminopimelate ligase